MEHSLLAFEMEKVLPTNLYPVATSLSIEIAH